MNNIVFPNDPTNGDVFEYSSGVYFQYSSATKSWKKIVGLSSVPLVSANNDGLMSKDDFNKLQSLMIPPPQTTLTTEECNTTFKEGIVKIESSNNDLNIVSSLDVLNKSKTEKVDFIIHENTFGIDFSINVNRLIEELELRNKIKYRSTPGPEGDQGERGKPGRDRIETGPRGPKGKDGINAPFPGTLVQDYSTVDQTRIKKVVVDIKNDPDDPKKLIVTFGNIGNLSACPDRIHWKNKKTPWLVALKDKIGPCRYPEGCYKNVCSTEIYYVDTTTIQDQIKERFVELLAAAKLDREVTVKNWLNAMIEMFNAQKQALCCAMEAIDTKEKNQSIRNTWSMGRYAAAQAMYAFKLTSDNDTKYPRAIPQQTPYDFLDVNQEQGGAKLNGSSIDAFNCDDCFLMVDLLGYNIGQTRPISIDLPAGSYVSTIIQCCSDYENAGSSGRYSIKFVDKDNNNNSIYNTYVSSDKGYMSSGDANAAYTGESMAFKHYGGVVSFYLTPPPPNSSPVSLSGGVKLCIQPTKCFESCESKNPTDATAVTAIVDPTIADLPSSYIRASHAEFYERGWRIGKACAVHTSIIGTQFIVVFRSLGADTSCGGGEYSTTPFIKYFQDQLGEQVAIAWPTIDGDGFFGLPRDDGMAKIQLVYDKDLSDMIVANINNDVIFKKIGDPKSVIKKVVVPILEMGYTDGSPDPVPPDDVKYPGIKFTFNGSDVTPIGPSYGQTVSLKSRSIMDNSIIPISSYAADAKSENNCLVSTSSGLFNMFAGFSYPNRAWNGPLPTRARAITGWYKQNNYGIGLELYANYTTDSHGVPNFDDSFVFQLTLNGSNVNGLVLVHQSISNQTAGYTFYSFDDVHVQNSDWIHIVLNRVNDKYIDLYINGVKAGTIGPIVVGDGSYQWAENLKAVEPRARALDQFRLYDQPLSESDIKSLFDHGRNAE